MDERNSFPPQGGDFIPPPPPLYPVMSDIPPDSPHHVPAAPVSTRNRGLIGGIGAYVKQLYPQVHIIGVEPEDAAAMYESIHAERRVRLEKLGLFADGVAVRRVGAECVALTSRYVDEIVKGNNEEV